MARAVAGAACQMSSPPVLLAARGHPDLKASCQRGRRQGRRRRRGRGQHPTAADPAWGAAAYFAPAVPALAATLPITTVPVIHGSRGGERGRADEAARKRRGRQVPPLAGLGERLVLVQAFQPVHHSGASACTRHAALHAGPAAADAAAAAPAPDAGRDVTVDGVGPGGKLLQDRGVGSRVAPMLLGQLLVRAAGAGRLRRFMLVWRGSLRPCEHL